MLHMNNPNSKCSLYFKLLHQISTVPTRESLGFCHGMLIGIVIGRNIPQDEYLRLADLAAYLCNLRRAELIEGSK